jgi:hypothetical protein
MWTALTGSVGSTTTIGVSFISQLMSIFTNPIFLAALGLAAVTSFIVGGGNFSVFFLFPILMLAIFANMFILPSNYMFDTSLPIFARALIGVFMNLILMLAIVNFVRGGT